MGFMDEIIEKAKKKKKTIVLPEASDKRIIEAASRVISGGIADIILIGNKEKIHELAEGKDVSKARIVDPENYDGSVYLAKMLYEIRKEKGMTLDKARELLKDPLYLGVMLVKNDEADGMVAGAINSTADTLRPALQILKTKPGTKIVSSFFLMVVPGCDMGEKGVFVFSDCGLVEDPDAYQLADIAIASAASFEQLTNKTPRVAMLSYSTYGSAKSDMTQKVVQATKIAREKAPDLLIDGELQADAAIVPEVGRSKAKGSTLAGTCNTLIFPDLNSGNISYKLVQRLAGAEAYGPVTQGIAKPVNDLSRGASASDIVGAIAITALQAKDGGDEI